MEDPRFKVWVQIEELDDEGEYRDLGLPDCIGEFDEEEEGRQFVMALLITVGSSDLLTSEQLPKAGRFADNRSKSGRERPVNACSPLKVHENGGHYCAGCGRCMVDGCDGRFNSHAANCARLFCLICGGDAGEAEESEHCTCASPSTATPYCPWCGALVERCAC
jgi:hypothetical protein